MLKRIGVGAAVLAVTALTLLAAPAAASAATRVAPYEVTFTPDPAACDGKVSVNTTNNLKGEHAVGLTFDIDGTHVNVDPDSTVTTVVNYPASQDIDVDLVGFYDPTPGGDVTLSKAQAVDRVDSEFVLKTHWDYGWERPAGCWDVKPGSLCNGHVALAAKNTSPAPGTILIQPDTSPAVEVVVAGNATFTGDYAASTVTWTIDKGEPVTYNWTQPVCTTPTPSTVPTTAPPVGRDTSNDLPATGAQSASYSVWGGTIALCIALAGGLVLWLTRRSRRQTAQSS